MRGVVSFRIVMDTSRQNGLSWDAIISCEAIGKYKVLPEAYKTCAKSHDSPHFPAIRMLRRFAPVPYQIGGIGG